MAGLVFGRHEMPMDISVGSFRDVLTPLAKSQKQLEPILKILNAILAVLRWVDRGRRKEGGETSLGNLLPG